MEEELRIGEQGSAIKLVWRAASEPDLPLAARMNKHLIEDEGSRNPMGAGELEARLREWLAVGWRLELLEWEGRAVAYVVYRLEHDEYFPQQSVVNLRHYFVEREYRRAGFGRRGIESLISERFPANARIVLGVLAKNPVGLAFWRSLGFEDYALTLVRTSP